MNNTTPALNATNLNKLQDNVEDAIQEVQDDADNLDTNKLDKSSVKNTYTESGTDTYGCNYINKAGKITFNNEWRVGFNIYGGGFITQIPIYNPDKKTPTLNLTSAEVFTSSWVSMTAEILSSNVNECIITFNTSANLSVGMCYLIRLKGTLNIN